MWDPEGRQKSLKEIGLSIEDHIWYQTASRPLSNAAESYSIVESGHLCNKNVDWSGRRSQCYHTCTYWKYFQNESSKTYLNSSSEAGRAVMNFQANLYFNLLFFISWVLCAFKMIPPSRRKNKLTYRSQTLSQLMLGRGARAEEKWVGLEGKADQRDPPRCCLRSRARMKRSGSKRHLRGRDRLLASNSPPSRGILKS